MLYANLLLNVLYHIVMEMKIRESCLQTGTFIYKLGISVTKQDFHLQMGSLGLQMGFSGYYLPSHSFIISMFFHFAIYFYRFSINSYRFKEILRNKKSTDLSVLSSGSNGARTRDLSRVRRTLIPAELCFHICYYSPFAEKYNLNLKIPLSRAKAAWPTAAPPLRHSPPETETQSGSPGALPDTAPFRP